MKLGSPRSPQLASAAAELAAGGPVLLVDDLNPPHRVDLVFAAAHASSELVAYAVRHTSGFLTVAVTDADADRLGLPLMWPWSTHSKQPRFTVAADAADGVTTGISAADRARTIRLIGSASSTEEQLRRPGHVVAVRTAAPCPREVFRAPEAAVGLLRIAGLHPAAAMGTLVEDEGDLTSSEKIRAADRIRDLVLVTATDVAAFLDPDAQQRGQPAAGEQPYFPSHAQGVSRRSAQYVAAGSSVVDAGLHDRTQIRP